jgi:hypothetical protein
MPAKKTKKPVEPKPVAKCPMCLTEYPYRPLDEPRYECTQCGEPGFDCCVAGTGVMCSSCEEDAEQDYWDDEEEFWEDGEEDFGEYN